MGEFIKQRRPLHKFKMQASYWLVFTTEIEVWAENEEHAVEVTKEHAKYLDESEWATKLDWMDAATIE